MNDLQRKTCMAIVNVFESGRALGNYGAVTLLRGDSGHLTYGRSQTTLASGNLYRLLNQYCAEPDATYAAELRPYLARLQQRDVTLDTDPHLKNILRGAGNDAAMHRVQDSFFINNFFTPAVAAATATSLILPLSQTVVYDSFIQGGWAKIRDRTLAAVGKVSVRMPEEIWIKQYVELRRAYLASAAPPLPVSVIRMDELGRLIDARQWDLPLPVTIRGVTITEAELTGDTLVPVPRSTVPEAEEIPRTLAPAVPYPRNAEVVKLQQLLAAKGYDAGQDGIFGPYTQAVLKRFQVANQLTPDAIAGPASWKALDPLL